MISPLKNGGFPWFFVTVYQRVCQEISLIRLLEGWLRGVIRLTSLGIARLSGRDPRCGSGFDHAMRVCHEYHESRVAPARKWLTISSSNVTFLSQLSKLLALGPAGEVRSSGVQLVKDDMGTRWPLAPGFHSQKGREPWVRIEPELMSLGCENLGAMWGQCGDL